MEVFFAVFTFCYGILTLLLLTGWIKIPEFKKAASQKDEGSLFLSVIIPVRNESANIGDLLEDLSRQSYAATNFEIIVVDDRSTDHTFQLIDRFMQKTALTIKVLRLQDGLKGKKRALQAGIEAARGEIIVTTDGDCRVKRGWLCSLNAFFVRKDLVMATGPVTFYKEQSLFKQLQTIEFASLTGTGAASLYFNFPNMCNGANMAFRKDAFESVRGYEGSWHIPSGDDEFLMHKMARQYPGRVYFLKCKDAIVTTQACRKVSAFVHQRKRWAGKWKLHKKNSIKTLAVFIFLYNLSFIVTLFLTIGGTYGPGWFFALAACKMTVEFIFLHAVLQFMKKKVHPLYFLLLQIIYPWYVVFVGLVSQTGEYQWKGRKVSNLKTCPDG